MRIKVFTVLMSALLISISSSLSAEEKITGAFGLKLGQTYTPQEAIDVIDDVYLFNPKRKFRSFSKYLVQITPKTHKVYAITGVGGMANDSFCEKEQALIMAILQKKYGKVQEDQFSLHDTEQIRQGNRVVGTQCSGFVDVNLFIVYLDEKLVKLAENERIALESEKVDSSGL